MKPKRLIVIALLLCAVALLAAACSASPVKISVLTEPDTLIVPRYGVPDLTGGTVLVTYEDETTKTVAMTELEVQNLDVNTEGKQTAVLVYSEGDKSYSTTLDLEVKEPRPTSITIDDANVKKDYYEGEYFSTENLVVTAHFAGGETKVVSAYAITPTKLEADTTAVRVSYRGVSTNCEVNVTAKALTEIAIETPFDKTEYYVNQTFSPEGISIKATFNNGDSLTVYDGDLSYLREDGASYRAPYSINDDKVLVTYAFRGVTKSVPVTLTLHDPEATELIVMEDGGAPFAFYEGEIFDFAEVDMIVRIVFLDVGPEDAMLGAPRFAFEEKALSVEDTVVDVWLKDYPDCTISVPVTVLPNPVEKLEITDLPIKTQYKEGESLDLTGLAISVTYTSGASVSVEYSSEGDCLLTAEPSTLTLSTTSVTVRFEGAETSFGVDVFPAHLKLESISLSDDCEVLRVYAVGDTPDSTGAAFVAVFDNGTVELLDYEDTETEVKVVSTSSEELGDVIDADSTGLHLTVSFLYDDYLYEGVVFIPITVE